MKTLAHDNGRVAGNAGERMRHRAPIVHRPFSLAIRAASQLRGSRQPVPGNMDWRHMKLIAALLFAVLMLTACASTDGGQSSGGGNSSSPQATYGGNVRVRGSSSSGM
ncbi:hypothetical protein Sfum_3093 [Syntrophobacter fumaroxidans MPOB]|uniref:Uncharacterized protein n=1 Tax=Syntrophobacter fumaroxidans (strain DSM 10017 / MPOB) TaxID=335543 RepID=A0LMW4_SYNFM|nr:hypothetical protein Sfum_3093 [Syntrophobacter fumaroxidans MPOB]